MKKLVKGIYKRGVLSLLFGVFFCLSSCGIKEDDFHRMPELMNRNTTFEKVDYAGPYTISKIANYKDKLYFTTLESGNGICEMELGDAYTETLFYTFSENEYGRVLTTDVYGNVYVVVSKVDENGKDIAVDLRKLTSEGEIVFQTDILSKLEGMGVSGIGADKEGYVYVRGIGFNKGTILVYNDSGEYSGEIDVDREKYALSDAIGRCADGYVYVALTDQEIGEDEIWGGAIARLDGKNNSLTIQDVLGIVSEGASFGYIGSTSSSDFVFGGTLYDAIYLSNYHAGTSVADAKISTYVAKNLPLFRCIVLDDGRLLCIRYTEDVDNTYQKRVIEFYYIPIEDSENM